MTQLFLTVALQARSILPKSFQNLVIHEKWLELLGNFCTSGSFPVTIKTGEIDSVKILLT